MSSFGYGNILLIAQSSSVQVVADEDLVLTNARKNALNELDKKFGADSKALGGKLAGCKQIIAQYKKICLRYNVSAKDLELILINVEQDRQKIEQQLLSLQREINEAANTRKIKNKLEEAGKIYGQELPGVEQRGKELESYYAANLQKHIDQELDKLLKEFENRSTGLIEKRKLYDSYYAKDSTLRDPLRADLINAAAKVLRAENENAAAIKNIKDGRIAKKYDLDDVDNAKKLLAEKYQEYERALPENELQPLRGYIDFLADNENKNLDKQYLNFQEQAAAALKEVDHYLKSRNINELVEQRAEFLKKLNEFAETKAELSKKWQQLSLDAKTEQYWQAPNSSHQDWINKKEAPLFRIEAKYAEYLDLKKEAADGFAKMDLLIKKLLEFKGFKGYVAEVREKFLAQLSLMADVDKVASAYMADLDDLKKDKGIAFYQEDMKKALDAIGQEARANLKTELDKLLAELAVKQQDNQITAEQKQQVSDILDKVKTNTGKAVVELEAMAYLATKNEQALKYFLDKLSVYKDILNKRYVERSKAGELVNYLKVHKYQNEDKAYKDLLLSLMPRIKGRDYAELYPEAYLEKSNIDEWGSKKTKEFQRLAACYKILRKSFADVKFIVENNRPFFKQLAQTAAHNQAVQESYEQVKNSFIQYLQGQYRSYTEKVDQLNSKLIEDKKACVETKGQYEKPARLHTLSDAYIKNCEDLAKKLADNKTAFTKALEQPAGFKELIKAYTQIQQEHGLVSSSESSYNKKIAVLAKEYAQFKQTYAAALKITGDEYTKLQNQINLIQDLIKVLKQTEVKAEIKKLYDIDKAETRLQTIEAGVLKTNMDNAKVIDNAQYTATVVDRKNYTMNKFAYYKKLLSNLFEELDGHKKFIDTYNKMIESNPDIAQAVQNLETVIDKKAQSFFGGYFEIMMKYVHHKGEYFYKKDGRSYRTLRIAKEKDPQALKFICYILKEGHFRGNRSKAQTAYYEIAQGAGYYHVNPQKGYDQQVGWQSRVTKFDENNEPLTYTILPAEQIWDLGRAKEILDEKIMLCNDFYKAGLYQKSLQQYWSQVPNTSRMFSFFVEIQKAKKQLIIKRTYGPAANKAEQATFDYLSGKLLIDSESWGRKFQKEYDIKTEAGRKRFGEFLQLLILNQKQQPIDAEVFAAVTNVLALWAEPKAEKP